MAALKKDNEGSQKASTDSVFLMSPSPQNIGAQDTKIIDTKPANDGNDSDTGSVFVPEKVEVKTPKQIVNTPKSAAAIAAERRAKKQENQYRGLFPCIPYMSQTVKIIISSFFIFGTMGAIVGSLFATGKLSPVVQPSPTPTAAPSPLPTSIFESNVVVSTFAGTGVIGNVDGPTAMSQFNNMKAMVCDAAGNVYIADTSNYVIRRISVGGITTTFAGNGTRGYADGPAANAMFDQAFGIAIDSSGDLIISDTGNNRIRKITQAGIVSTVAGSTAGYVDGPGVSARFNLPYELTVAGGNIYVADANNQVIRMINGAGVVSTFAGSPGIFGADDGSTSSATFYNPRSIAIDSNNTFYILENGNAGIRKIESGVVTSMLGGNNRFYQDGNSTIARLRNPGTIVVGRNGTLYVSELAINRIRKVSESGFVTTLAGNGNAGLSNGAGPNSTFNAPSGLALHPNGSLLVADSSNNVIRNISFS